MTVPAAHPTVPRTRHVEHVHELDTDLRRAVRHVCVMRQLFYAVVLVVALAGQVSGAVERLDISVLWALPAVAGLELGGVVVMANADIRRRLGERAIASRLLSMLVAAGAVAFNWNAHSNHLLGTFFAGMSALGYLVWLMHIENQRRDRLRATGDLPPTTPAYELVEHWLRHPALTLRARSLAKANPGLGLYDSLDAARDRTRRQHREHAISIVLHRKIRAAVDPATADIAVAVYGLDKIAARLAASADYDTLTTLLNTDLTPARLTAQTTAHQTSAQPHPPAIAATASQTPPRPNVAAAREQKLVDTLASDCPGVPAGSLSSAPPPNVEASTTYQPTGNEDTAMYHAWQRGVANGQEPSGADLARAAGRADDATGIGRRAARRYRDAHGQPPPHGHTPPRVGSLTTGATGIDHRPAERSIRRDERGCLPYVLPHHRVAARPHLIPPPMPTEQLGRPRQRLGHRRIGQPGPRLDVHHAHLAGQ
jgi:hypothetical protein